VFYNDSAYDGRSAGADARDDAALATDKLALMPGKPATLANVTNFAGGINGIFVDVKGLRAEMTANDFIFAMSAVGGGDWLAAPDPVSISRRVGAGIGGSDRVTLVWPDGAVVNRWLRVTIQATDDNDFAADDVFYIGNLVGETGDDPTRLRVTANDLLRIRARQSRPTSLTDWFDFNRDGRVNTLDQAIARANFSNQLVLIAPAPAPTAASQNGVLLAAPLRRSTARRSRYEPPSALLA